MWERKNLKSNAKHTLKKNYWAIVAVSFILLLLAGMFSSGEEAINSYNSANATQEAVQNAATQQSATDVIRAAVTEFTGKIPQDENLQAWVRALGDIVIEHFASSQSIIIVTLRIVISFMQAHLAMVAWVLLAGMLVRAAYYVFVENILRVGGRRFYLETRTYDDTEIHRVFWVYRHGKTKNVAAVMLRRSVYNWLWDLTIVGGIIKSFEYKMIPWLLAENPEMDYKTAFALSKQMMQGNKWRTFVLELSFILWDVLDFVTFGLLSIFFLNPYKICTQAELYATLRAAAKEAAVPGSEALQDAELYTQTTPAATVNGKVNNVYPDALGRLHLRHPGKFVPVNADRKYSLLSLILLFFIFSFVGWVWEVMLHLVQDGVFVNRGTMFGPWLPIYGSGGVLVILLLRRFMKKPALTFFLTMAVCGTVEYFTSWYLEKTRGIKWWDYSGYFMNLNGRICLLGLVVFGLGGCAFLYYVAPRVDDLLQKVPYKVRVVAAVVLCALFGADMAYSHFHPNTGKGITDYPGSAALGAAQLTQPRF